jgi:hypothetical protein
VTDPRTQNTVDWYDQMAAWLMHETPMIDGVSTVPSQQ